MTAPRTSTQFSQALGTAARAVMQGLEVSASVLPGGSLVSAAVRGARAGLDSGLGGAGSPNAPAGAAASSTESLLASGAYQNMQFLQLQEQLQAENRRYTALSNAMNTRHETAKNAIGNLR